MNYYALAQFCRAPVCTFALMVKVECVAELGCRVGESPLWEARTSTLLYVDVLAGTVGRWDPNTKQSETRTFEKTVSCVVPRVAGGYMVACGLKIAAMDWETAPALLTYAEVDNDKPNNRFNDGKADPEGRMLAGTMALELKPAELELGQGSLYSLDVSGTVRRLLSPVDVSNGMGWSLDGRKLYYVDSLKYRVDAFDYDLTTGNIDNRQTVYQCEKEDAIPDGLCMDAGGKIWLACYNGGRVICIDPNSGQRLQVVKLPVDKTTSCCFGGLQLTDLYVTTAHEGLDEAGLLQQPLSGGLFRVTDLGVKGLPSFEFAG
uniref:regucalcin isoform X2 n=1 Tax=Myxine glutinosa TaxID=7769 RepID=UPI00358FFB56